MKKVLALVLSLVMVLGLCSTALAYTHWTSKDPSPLETKNSDFAMNAASQGYVLFENNGVLPLDNGEDSVSLWGNGVKATVKGGTGSGAVNNRFNDNMYSAFVDAGWTIANPAFCGKQTTTLSMPGVISDADLAEGVANTDLAIYIISRQAGEFSDRTASSNNTRDYYLSANEKTNIEMLAANFDKFIVIYNTCVCDAEWLKTVDGVDAVVYMHNGGQRGNEAMVKCLTGEVTFSGKVTDTWPCDYTDYPSTAGFANNDGNTRNEFYTDGIYVGYRYFDTWGLPVTYEFGFGLSYTTFDMKVVDVDVASDYVTVDVQVVNTGAEYSGKEVVEVYFSAPDGELEVPYQELAGFAKTDELEPGAKQVVTVQFKTTDMSSYNERLAAYVMQAGQYVIRVGNSSRNTHVAATATLAKDTIVEQLSNQVVPEIELEEISKKGQTPITYEGEAAEIAAAPKFVLADLPYENNASKLDDEAITTYLFAEDAENYVARDVMQIKTKNVAGIINNNPDYTKSSNSGYSTTTYTEKVQIVPALPAGMTKESAKLSDVYTGKITMDQFLACLSSDELSRICVGGATNVTAVPAEETIQNYYQPNSPTGTTTTEYFQTRHIPNMPNQDGPAGIRVNTTYTLNGQTCYRYATAFPAGGCMAMTWDANVIYEEGVAIGSEMDAFGIVMWLAPGVNIHRNPLCGRNFEYYAEDPLQAGMVTAYVTQGLQSWNGIGVTMKHCWGNSQETNRNAENNIISERASREIYLKQFEIGVKYAQAMAIMNSYNCNNGWPASDSWDLNRDLMRGEWGFNGVVMTDWGGGQSSPFISMHGGCNLIMSGGNSQLNNVRNNYGIKDPTFKADGSINNAGTFVPAAGGQFEYKTGVIAGGYEAIPASVKALVNEGAAKICVDAAGTFVTYWGNHLGTICLGDLQLNARAVLEVGMKSYYFDNILDQVIGAGDYIGSFSKACDSILSTWAMEDKSEVVNTSVVADTVETTCGDKVAVDVNYTGDEAITSVRIAIDSALPIDSIESAYDFEYNKANGWIVVYNEDGTAIGGKLFTINYDLSAEPWYANGVYAIDIEMVDATAADAEYIELVAIDGAVIIANVYPAGDIDMNGKVTNADVIAIARYLVDLVEFTAEQLEIADVDDNDVVNNIDLVMVARGIVGK